MATTKEQRTEKINKLAEEFGKATGIYLTDFTGINVEKITKFREDLRENSSRYVVVKNSLAKKAFGKIEEERLDEYLTGPVGVAFTSDEATAPAKAIKEFQKKNEALLKVKVALVNNNLYSEQDVKKLADIPSREVLLSQLLSCLKAPMTNLACGLSGVITKFARTLEAVKQKKEDEE